VRVRVRLAHLAPLLDVRLGRVRLCVLLKTLGEEALHLGRDHLLRKLGAQPGEAAPVRLAGAGRVQGGCMAGAWRVHGVCMACA
jgi:hypothetical protein